MATHKTIIVGAGPAGLQLAYFLEKGGHDYVVLERAPIAASFFDRFPHSGKLISINKKHTGSDIHDFNLRHDWNSLLNDEKFDFTSFSDDFYPDKKDLVAYMNEFAKRFKLKIQYSSEVMKISKGDGAKGEPPFRLQVKQKGVSTLLTCEKLIVATGMSKPHIPAYINKTIVAPKHYAEYPKDHFKRKEVLDGFRNKSVMIIGNGNSGMELANLLTPYCSNILVHGRHPKPWAASTHYTGDLRSVYMPFLDTFLLKSQNGLNNLDEILSIGIDQPTAGAPYTVYSICSEQCKEKHEIIISKPTYDHVIFCTGWKFDDSIFDFPVTKVIGDKYPLTAPDFESEDAKGLYFIGALGHIHDYKKSSGGFIHGFRYLIEHFYHENYDEEFDIDTFPVDNLEPLVKHIMFKLNSTSPMYQMYGVIGDFFILDSEKESVTYYNNVPHHYMMKLLSRSDGNLCFSLRLQYGEKEVTEMYELGLKKSRVGTESHSTLLHPVLRVLVQAAPNMRKMIDEIHFDENLFAKFEHPTLYTHKLARALRMFF